LTRCGVVSEKLLPDIGAEGLIARNTFSLARSSAVRRIEKGGG